MIIGAIVLLPASVAGLFYSLSVFKFGARSERHFFAALFILMVSLMSTVFAVDAILNWSIR